MIKLFTRVSRIHLATFQSVVETPKIRYLIAMSHPVIMWFAGVWSCGRNQHVDLGKKGPAYNQLYGSSHHFWIPRQLLFNFITSAERRRLCFHLSWFVNLSVSVKTLLKNGWTELLFWLDCFTIPQQHSLATWWKNEWMCFHEIFTILSG